LFENNQNSWLQEIIPQNQNDLNIQKMYGDAGMLELNAGAGILELECWRC
jgi:hypothetical protein